MSTINGLGLQADNDWYEILTTAGFNHLIIDLQFTHADGDINVELYDSTGTYITGSYSTTDNELLEYTVGSASATYYILVYFANGANMYDLWWDDIIPTVNLVATTVFGPASCNAGDDITVNRMFQNTGNSDSGTFTYGLYLSTDTTISVADIEIYTGTFDIPAGGTSNVPLLISLPPGVSGTYYYGLIVDLNGDVGETNEADNSIASLATVFIDDAYEDNDAFGFEYDLSAYEDTYLDTVDGYGYQADDDWYEIYVAPGDERLQVEVLFTHADGNIDVGVYNSTGSLVTWNNSATDNEYMDYVVSSPGTYYLRVLGPNQGNVYNLWWDDVYVPTTATATGPVGGPSNNPDVTVLYDVTGYPSIVDLFYTTDTGAPYFWTWFARDDGLGDYDWTIPADGMYGWMAVTIDEPVPTSVDPAEAGYYIYDGTGPQVNFTTPADGALGVSPYSAPFTITFDERMMAVGTPIHNLPAMAGWNWVAVNTIALDYMMLDPGSTYYVDLNGQGFSDEAGNPLAGDQYFEFTVAFNVRIWEASGSDDWILVSYPNDIEGDPLSVLVDTIDEWGSGLVTWDIVQWFDTEADEWKSTATFKPPVLNTFTYVNNTMSFWIHITNYGDGNISLGGQVPSPGNTTNIPLKTGWNLVGYPSLTWLDIATALAGTGYDQPVEGYDSAAPYYIIPLLDTYLMRPGEGYWVHVPVDTVWTVDW